MQTLQGRIIPYHNHNKEIHMDSRTEKLMKGSETIVVAGSLCLACDWDCDSANPEDLFETYLTLERLNLWAAIGLYPAWHRLGFHVDLRPSAHPSYRARWFRDSTGEYRALSWANWREYAL
mgnify:CR=1 FL=1